MFARARFELLCSGAGEGWFDHTLAAKRVWEKPSRRE